MDRDRLQQMFTRVSTAAHVKTSLVIVRDANRAAWTDGDKIYITTSLVESLPEDQVAAVVSHEFGHIIGKHIATTEAALQDLRGRIYKDDETIGGFSKALVEGSIAVARQYRSRRQEYQADSIGEALTNRAGYGSGKMAQTLEEIAAPHQTPTILDSHPTTPARISKLEQPRKIRIKIVRKR